MNFITSEKIQDISVKTVEGFLNNKVPLSAGLAKYASELELNSEQIQRAVEATNSIAYLKVLSLSDDRTVEFPLCKFAEVMGAVSVPTMMIVKSASVGKSTDPVTVIVPTELTVAEQQTHFIKFAAINESELNALRDRAETIVPELLKAASVVKADEQGLEKLATVAEDQVYAMASALVYGEVKTHEDTGLFKAAELKAVEHLVGLLKEATELNVQIKEKQDLADRSELVKEAILGAIGSAIGRTLGAAVKAPFKVVGQAAARTASNVGNSMGNFVRGKAGLPPVNKPIKKFGLGAGLATAAGVGTDALLYQPGRDKTTGRSKDVWTSLQREQN